MLAAERRTESLPEPTRSGSGGLAAVEWPTVSLLIVVYAAFGALTWFGNSLPWWLLVAAGGYLVCLFGSLMHESTHGHPTRNCLVNEALVFVPFALWFPYRRYRKLHLQHHRDDHLTDPQADPESYYMEPQSWAGTPAAMKWLLTVNNTLAGRMLIGPLISATRFVAGEIRRIRSGDRQVLIAWLLHAAGLAILWAWLTLACEMAFWRYVVFIAYPGISLTFLRTFAEHRAHGDARCRTIIVESNPVMALVFLNNNLHAAHHEKPSLAWYRLPEFYAKNRERLISSTCEYLVRGYWRFFASYLLRAKEPVAHPLPERNP